MKKIGAAIAAIVALALGSIAIYSQTISSESVPADDEITLHIQLDTEEDVGLLIYDLLRKRSRIQRRYIQCRSIIAQAQ